MYTTGLTVGTTTPKYTDISPPLPNFYRVGGWKWEIWPQFITPLVF